MKIGIVGSGPTGVAAAATALKQGHTVEILDVGHTLPVGGREWADRLRRAIESGQSPTPADLKELGAQPPVDINSVIGLLPATGLRQQAPVKSILGSKFVYDGINENIPVEGGTPPRSLAMGGLSNVWGTACYKLQDTDYSEWPFEKFECEPHYETAAEILRFPAEAQSTVGSYPPGNNQGSPAGDTPWNMGSPLDGLTGKWSFNRDLLDQAGMRIGRSSLATVPPDAQHSERCRQCGLCFYGCPFGAMYRSGIQIDEWLDHPRFKYRKGVLVKSFREENGQVMVDTQGDDGTSVHSFDRFVLAANTLSSLRIVSDSIAQQNFRAPLLDNDMFVVPMLADVGMSSGWQSKFALSESVMSVAPGVVSERPVHLQFYSFNDYFLGAASRLVPAIFRRSKFLSRLVIAFMYLHSDESREAHATPIGRGNAITNIKIGYRERNGRAIARRLLNHLGKHKGVTGLSPFRTMLKSTPFGFSGHLAGTLPMQEQRAAISGAQRAPSTKSNGQLAGMDRVFVADASNFPSLPAQNPTFTAMANAVRIVSNF